MKLVVADIATAELMTLAVTATAVILAVGTTKTFLCITATALVILRMVSIHDIFYSRLTTF